METVVRTLHLARPLSLHGPLGQHPPRPRTLCQALPHYRKSTSACGVSSTAQLQHFKDMHGSWLSRSVVQIDQTAVKCLLNADQTEVTVQPLRVKRKLSPALYTLKYSCYRRRFSGSGVNDSPAALCKSTAVYGVFATESRQVFVVFWRSSISGGFVMSKSVLFRDT